MRKLMNVIAVAMTAVFGTAQAVADAGTITELWRLDCGTMQIDDISYFSDAYVYDGQAAFVTNGCYLVRHNDSYLLWDAGLPREVLGNTEPDEGWVEAISETISDQLSEIGLSTDDIDYIANSENFDRTV